MRNLNGTVYEFGPFRLDASARRLYCDGRLIPLAPKVFETLLVLVENNGQALTKESLMEKVWPDTFVEESSLSQNIFLLRRALKEGGDDRTFIETLPRRGYRFVAEVRSAVGPEAVLPGTGLEDRSETRIVIEDAFARELEADRESLTWAPLRAMSSPRRAGTWALLAVLMLCIPALILGSNVFSRNTGPRPQAETVFQTFDLARLTDSGNVCGLALTSDGQRIAYVSEDGGKQSLWLRQRVGGGLLKLLPAEEGKFTGLTFSPDGNYIYYTLQASAAVSGTLYRVAALGGPSVKVLDNLSGAIGFAPNGKQFAFVRWETGKAESYLMVADTDGGSARAIAQRSRPNFFGRPGPSWSPDGRRIACAAGGIELGRAKMGVVTVEISGGSPQELAPPKWAWVGQVSWLPDGSGLALVSWDEEAPQLIDQLWTLSYPDGHARRITTDLDGYGGVGLAADAGSLVAVRVGRHAGLWLAPRGDEGHATAVARGLNDPAGGDFLAMTPDGRIVYSSTVGGHPDLWAMDRDGGRKKQLTDDAAEEERPVITPDGKGIYFGSRRGGAPHIWRIDVDGSNLTQVTSGLGELSPGLTPDGRWLIYTNVAEKFSLWKVAVAGGAPIRLTDKPALNPALAPDGKLIACYFKVLPGAPLQLTLVSSDNGAPVKVFDRAAPDNYPPLSWTPDGRFVTYLNTRAGVSNVWGQPTEGGEPKPLTAFSSDQIYRYSWSPDGKQVLCERGYSQRDIVALSNSAVHPANEHPFMKFWPLR
jgi:Tol biopolymer transport system component/DNA-binding winged helix-turn-helix (wHTH) protein